MEITYERIAANVASTRIDGSKVEVHWRCAASNQPMGHSEAYMAPDHSLQNEVTSSLKRSVVREIGYGITRFFGNLLGGGAGRVLHDASSTATSRVSTGVSTAAQYTEKSKKDAIVQAFKQVRDRFRWDEGRQQFVAGSGQS
jgi:hypothetical protein